MRLVQAALIQCIWGQKQGACIGTFGSITHVKMLAHTSYTPKNGKKKKNKKKTPPKGGDLSIIMS